MQLQDKNIVIIGGTTGMGLSAARSFIREGARIVVVGRNEQSVHAAGDELGDAAIAFSADATQTDTAVKAIQLCREQYGGFDGLYHVAGGSGRNMGDGPLHELSLEGWNWTLHMNLTALMLSNQAAVRAFLALKKGGTILNMGSVLGFSPSPRFFSTHGYAAAKSAIIGFSKSIAAYYAKNDIRVNVIAPALVETPMAQRAANNPEILSFIKTKQPLDGGRIGSPEDCDGLAVYFMSDQSKFTTGQVVAVDGGWSVSEP
ncbi:MAG TPA: SDR family oxidoreductase [Chitinophagaceae bacterium]|nr:SDR family oxidoreductase [Chitinophagaceae bacterium]